MSCKDCRVVKHRMGAKRAFQCDSYGWRDSASGTIRRGELRTNAKGIVGYLAPGSKKIRVHKIVETSV
ncbi:hypothetical protein DFA_10517 [Cavenderia fasciculata]|uniref:Uncharacterized protein n=1 Tax=Cavenderia fasciculata TaxID=261658 RepID=F4QAF6_CACFS|nr:uncharacterized protein DFA_10517 [Cavenderia fasciculata]EGG15675.1 hypothetical protein DFA_10517 [Cavenderia fasciculata]|eukprot:XP_004354417.1 hypothetical protein DFA_10517 [Cavenderia fasciculata]